MKLAVVRHFRDQLPWLVSAMGKRLREAYVILKPVVFDRIVDLAYLVGVGIWLDLSLAKNECSEDLDHEFDFPGIAPSRNWLLRIAVAETKEESRNDFIKLRSFGYTGFE